jgi:hypothetical protein
MVEAVPMVCASENYHRLVHVPPRVPVPEEKGTIGACSQRLLSPKILCKLPDESPWCFIRKCEILRACPPSSFTARYLGNQVV